jgi:hypothetical protein
MQTRLTKGCHGNGEGVRSGVHSAHESYPVYFVPSQVTLLLRPPLDNEAGDDPNAINVALERELPDTLEKYFGIRTHVQVFAIGDERGSVRQPVLIRSADGPLVLHTVNLPGWRPWDRYLEHVRLELDAEGVEAEHFPGVSDVGEALVMFENPEQDISSLPPERYRPVGVSPNWLAVPFCY